MRLPRIFRLRFRSLFARNKVERELDEELQYHLEREIEQYVAAGMSVENAHQAALRAIGPITQRKEECRDMRGLNWIDNALQDFRYAIRQLRKIPGFACAATFVFGLGHLRRGFHFRPRRSSAYQASALPRPDSPGGRIRVVAQQSSMFPGVPGFYRLEEPQ